MQHEDSRANDCYTLIIMQAINCSCICSSHIDLVMYDRSQGQQLKPHTIWYLIHKAYSLDTGSSALRLLFKIERTSNSLTAGRVEIFLLDTGGPFAVKTFTYQMLWDFAISWPIPQMF